MKRTHRRRSKTGKKSGLKSYDIEKPISKPATIRNPILLVTFPEAAKKYLKAKPINKKTIKTLNESTGISITKKEPIKYVPPTAKELINAELDPIGDREW